MNALIGHMSSIPIPRGKRHYIKNKNFEKKITKIIMKINTIPNIRYLGKYICYRLSTLLDMKNTHLRNPHRSQANHKTRGNIQ